MLKFSLFSIILLFSFFLLFNSVLAANLNPPNIIYPKASDSPIWAGKIEFQWESISGVNFYQYHIDLPGGADKEELVSATSKEIYDLNVGNYSWAVRSCQDSTGANCGQWSDSQSFTIVAAPTEFQKGLVPCGRLYDDPSTSEINESKPCQITDIFVLLKNILDFLLWRLGLIILVLLVIATGVIFYFSMGGPTTMVQAKSILRSAFFGYLFIFLAWTITNLLLKLLGYTIKWWIITF